MEIPSGEQFQASAVRFLIDGQEEDAANILLACTVKVEEGDDQPNWNTVYIYLSLVAPRIAYDILFNREHYITTAIDRAFNAVCPMGITLSSMIIRAELLMNIDPDWHKELLEIARGKGIHNQLAEARPAQTWNNLRFRSVSEVRIAQALDRTGVFFLPNCKGRLSLPGKRENKEPDFLICLNGKWGILEVDGEPFHPPSRTVEDHERDRLFKQHGIRVVEHYDANRCYEHPEEVVDNFLKLLNQA